MTLIARRPAPLVIQIGKACTLTRELADTTSAVLTASSATLTLRAPDGTLVLDAVAVTSLGPPITHSITAGLTEDYDPSDRWLATWTVTVSGDVDTIVEPVSLVRKKFHQMVTDSDLEARHSGLLDLRASDETFDDKRTLAHQSMEKRLARVGRRPVLIWDDHQLHDCLVYEVLALVFRDWGSRLDSRYTDLAREYEAKAKTEFEDVKFRYDDGGSGSIDDDDLEAGRGPVTLTAGPSRWGW